ncbi:hypothetical protein DSUL_120009 [Desulfovibrionales bacterium]
MTGWSSHVQATHNIPWQPTCLMMVTSLDAIICLFNIHSKRLRLQLMHP